jgi:hypothetical protein
MSSFLSLRWAMGRRAKAMASGSVESLHPRIDPLP